MRILHLFTLIFAVTISITYAIVDESDAPFIYYFSPSERAIIIERADTADRTTIDLNKIIPDDHNIIHSLQASPSGEWIAWISGVRASPVTAAAFQQRGWIVKISDQHVIPLGDDYVDRVVWSPTLDQLAILYTPDDDYYGYKLRQIKIIDAAADRTIVGNMWLEEFYETLHWHVEGELLYFTTQIEDYDLASETTTRYDTQQLVTISSTGEISTRPIIEEPIPSIYALPRGQLYHWRNDGVRVIETLISTGDVFPLPQLERVVTNVIVSPTQSHALIYVNTTQPEDIPHRELWLLNLEDYSLLHLADDAIPLINDVGFANPFYELEDVTVPQTSWTPDGNFALFSTAAGDAYWLNLETLSIEAALTSLPPPQEVPYDYVLGSFFAEDGTGYILRSGRIYGYDWQIDTLSADSPMLRTGFGVSSNGDYLAVIGRCNRLSQPESSDGKCLLNPPENRMHQLPPLPRTDSYPYTNQVDTMEFGLLNWHPTQDWIIIGENIEDRYIRWAYSVSDAEGYFYRALPVDVVPMWLYK